VDQRQAHRITADLNNAFPYRQETSSWYDVLHEHFVGHAG
jgi:hypothetical protein